MVQARAIVAHTTLSTKVRVSASSRKLLLSDMSDRKTSFCIFQDVDVIMGVCLSTKVGTSADSFLSDMSDSKCRHLAQARAVVTGATLSTKVSALASLSDSFWSDMSDSKCCHLAQARAVVAGATLSTKVSALAGLLRSRAQRAPAPAKDGGNSSEASQQRVQQKQVPAEAKASMDAGA